MRVEWLQDFGLLGATDSCEASTKDIAELARLDFNVTSAVDPGEVLAEGIADLTDELIKLGSSVTGAVDLSWAVQLILAKSSLKASQSWPGWTSACPVQLILAKFPLRASLI